MSRIAFALRGSVVSVPRLPLFLPPFLSPSVPDGMEKKPKSWWVDFVLVCSVLLLAESARGVVIGTLSPYLTSLGGDSFFLGVVVAAFSVGRLIASFAFGLLSDYWTTRSVLLLSTVGCMVGNFLYCFSATVSSKYLLLCSRILTGFGTGMLSVARTHVSVTTPGEERTLWMSWLGIVQFVGFAITPVIGNVKVDVNLRILPVNTFTFATLLLLVLEVLLFVCLLVFMSKRSTVEEAERAAEQAQIDAGEQQAPEVNGGQLESVSEYAQLQEGDGAGQYRQREINDRAAEEEEKNVYLDDDIYTPMHKQRSSSSASADWHGGDLLSTSSAASEFLTSQPSRTALDSMRERDVIVYMEEHTPRGAGIRYKPHHFKFSSNPDDSTAPGTLVASATSTPELPILTPANQPPSDLVLPPSPEWSRLTRLYFFLRQSYVPLVFVFLNFSGRGVLSVAEAYGTRMYGAITNPDDPSAASSGASTFFLVMGCIGLLVFLCLNRLVKYVEETNLLMLAFISMGIGFGVIVDFDDYDIDIYDFTAAMCLVWSLGTPISQTLSVSLLSKHFSQQQKAGIAPTKGVGFWMGLVTASGSVGRIVFPLLAGALYEPYGVSSAMLFTSLVSFLTVPVIFFALKAYRPYLPFIKERLPCCFRADDSSDMQPHTMARSLSGGPATELVLHSQGGDQVDGSPQLSALLSSRSLLSSGPGGASLPPLTEPPLVYFVSSQVQPSSAGPPATPSTPLISSRDSSSSLLQTGPARLETKRYLGMGTTPLSTARGRGGLDSKGGLSRVGDHYTGDTHADASPAAGAGPPLSRRSSLSRIGELYMADPSTPSARGGINSTQ